MATLGSMAAWCTHRAGQNEASAEIHFNYWRVAQRGWFNRPGRPSRDFAEVGVFIHKPAQIENVKIFLPFKLTDTELQDCGPHFKKVEIAQGIFNEALTCNSAGSPGPARVELLQDGKQFCRVHLFPIENGKIDQNQLTRVEEASGTLITVNRAVYESARTRICLICREISSIVRFGLERASLSLLS
jgi:hypothetical protein